MTDYFYLRKEQLEKLLSKYELEVNKLPDGTLAIYNNGTRCYHHTKTEEGKSTRSYIPKENYDLVRKLAIKTLLLDNIRDAKNELAAIKAYLKVRKKCRYNNILSKDSPYLQFLSPQFAWLDDDGYESNPNHPEALIIKAPKGQFVRSKSEAIIAYALFENHLSYQYEAKQIIDNIIVYPDFSIRHPGNGKTYIWEHFGLADQTTYQNSMTSKIRNYINAGYVPGDNLILTFETKDCPLDISYVHTLIQYHFGPFENRI